MKKYTLIILIYLLVLLILFAGISLLVYIFNGNVKLIEKKLRIGAMIISLTGVVSTCTPTQHATCYEMSAPEPKNFITINNYFQNIKIQIDARNPSITGSISNRVSSLFSYAIKNESGTIFQKGNIFSDDGKFDEYDETFIIHIDKNLSNGNYIFYIFNVPENNQTPETKIFHANLNISR